MLDAVNYEMLQESTLLELVRGSVTCEPKYFDRVGGHANPDGGLKTFRDRRPRMRRRCIEVRSINITDSSISYFKQSFIGVLSYLKYLLKGIHNRRM